MSGTQCTLSELLEGYNFYFRVSAVNGLGQGPPCTTKESTLIRDPITAPDPPSYLRVDGVTGSSVTLKWNVPQSLGNLPLSTYIVEKLVQQDDGNGKTIDKWIRCNSEAIRNTTYTVSGLQNEKPTLRVIAVNEAGNSRPSNAVGPVNCKDEVGKPYCQPYLPAF